MRTSSMVLVLAAAACLVGCASKRGEREFGSSVRHMVTGQSHNPAAPETNAVSPVDGEKAGLAVKAYRTDPNSQGPTPASALVIPIGQ